MYKAELAKKYNISPKTLCRWCKSAGIQTGNKKFLLPAELQEIYKHFGEPTS
jgi:uncharacterized protein YjcR